MFLEVILMKHLQIPSPIDAEGHQFQNASLMADLAGSRIITEDELDSSTLRIAIRDIFGMHNCSTFHCNFPI